MIPASFIEDRFQFPAADIRTEHAERPMTLLEELQARILAKSGCRNEAWRTRAQLGSVCAPQVDEPTLSARSDSRAPEPGSTDPGSFARGRK